MTLPRGLWDRHIQLLRGVSDAPRPVLQARVVDLSRYSAVGASWVGVRLGNEVVQAAYRDGPSPLLDDMVLVKRGDAPLDAPWYAWPLPHAPSGVWSVVSAPGVGSVHSLGGFQTDDNGNTYRQIAYDETGHNWEPIAAALAGTSPIAGATLVQGSTGPHSQTLYRHIFTVPSGATTAVLTVYSLPQLTAIYFDNTYVGAGLTEGATLIIDLAGVFTPGAPSILALTTSGNDTYGEAAWKIAGELA